VHSSSFLPFLSQLFSLCREQNLQKHFSLLNKKIHTAASFYFFLYQLNFFFSSLLLSSPTRYRVHTHGIDKKSHSSTSSSTLVLFFPPPSAPSFNTVSIAHWFVTSCPYPSDCPKIKSHSISKTLISRSIRPWTRTRDGCIVDSCTGRFWSRRWGVVPVREFRSWIGVSGGGGDRRWGGGCRIRVAECQRRSERQRSSDAVRREERGMERCTRKWGAEMRDGDERDEQ
jgi:hypothetical protein